MLKTLWFAILLILGAWPATLGAQERYLVSYNGFGVGQAPVWATKDFGLFAKYGLNTDLVMISGSAPGTQALVGGSTHFAQTDGRDSADRGHQSGSGPRAHRRRRQQVSL